MKKIVTLTVLLVLAIAASADTAEILRTETTKNLKENLLPFWMEKTVDPQGGFYGVVLNDGRAIENAPKGAVLNARITWTFSRAYRQDGLEVYKQMADRAADYYIRHFIDPVYGGGCSETLSDLRRESTRQGRSRLYRILSARLYESTVERRGWSGECLEDDEHTYPYPGSLYNTLSGVARRRTEEQPQGTARYLADQTLQSPYQPSDPVL